MAKGVKTGGGNRKGSPNKINKEVKDMILGALNEAGGQDYLLTQAKNNPVAFLSLVGKIIPKDLNAKVSGPDCQPIIMPTRIEIVSG